VSTKNHNHSSRRKFLLTSAKTLAGASFFAGLTSTAHAAATSTEQNKPAPQTRFQKGQTFNESEFFEDLVTSRPTLRLTTGRDYNQTPTYHLNTAFSADSRYIILASSYIDGDSYLFKADVQSGEITVLAVLPKNSGEKFYGNSSCVVQASNWVAASTRKKLRICHLETMEERVLLDISDGPGYLSIPAGSIDGTKIFVPRSSGYVTRGQAEEVSVTHLEVDIQTGKVKELFHDKGRACNHIIPNPSDPDLLLIDRDLPPLYFGGGDYGKTTRAWVLNKKTGKLTEIRPKGDNRFQVHSNWNYRGDLVYSHGNPNTGGHYLCVSDVNGKVVWQRRFSEYHYGHMSTHTRKNVMITDGLFTRHLVTAIHFEALDESGAPHLEILAKHDTNWSQAQHSHPHCHVSPDGKWLSYNRTHKERSDVYIVRIE